ncbi:hypothetical protein OIT44_02485 [Weissella ceti]|uniref:Peptidase S9 prolyl oligopeptidase catalytic domain-containing protein n=1 Tax=Weissella ceti TaxID=759620 RepID=A0ABT3E3E4_9LACO|nr:hypothetical protein [Weissella ceti]MCW0952938.1 hypothetical protein [Weissella ceti]QVK11484.1 hypothetical protein KHQ31_04495 [Weissella ceti]
MSKEEIVFHANNGTNVTYMEDPYPVENKIGQQKLLIIFSSLGDEKSDDPRKRFPYTLIDGLKFYNCRKLYIKDDHGLVGDYYLGVNGKLDTQKAVLDLINSKIQEYGIESKNIMTFGFSKGGYAAIMFGYLLNINTVMASVPQFDLDHWIQVYKPFLDYIYPENYTVEDREFYANYLDNVIKDANYVPKKVYLITSKNDNTYYEHIPQLVTALEKSGTELKVFHNNEYVVTRHNNVVKNSLNEILAILSYELSHEDLKNML